MLSFVTISFVAGLPALQQQLLASVQALRDWAVHGPLGVDPSQIGRAQQQLLGWLHSNWQRLASGAVTTVLTVGGLVTSTVLVAFALVFFLYNGAGIWQVTCRIAPPTQRRRLQETGHRAFRALISYVRAIGLVALADAAGIGLALWIVGVPLAGPLTALVFLGGFLPVVGALVSGALAVLVTLVTQGVWATVIILAVVILVQQLEGNVLQPWLLGNAAHLHPLGVVVAVSTGAIVAGIIGALLAVPAVLVVRAAVHTWSTVGDADNTAPQQAHGREEPPTH